MHGCAVKLGWFGERADQAVLPPAAAGRPGGAPQNMRRPFRGGDRCVAVPGPGDHMVDPGPTCWHPNALADPPDSRSVHDGTMATDEVLHELLERCRSDHHAWINGDGSPYALPPDGTIMGAVGGYSFGGPQTAARQAAVAAHWLAGSGEVEVVNGGVIGGVAWLAMIERARVVFDRNAGGQWRDLRVTEIFRRADGNWQRVHRHAGPLVDRRSLTDAAMLLA
jgi:hypothetical protein